MCPVAREILSCGVRIVIVRKHTCTHFYFLFFLFTHNTRIFYNMHAVLNVHGTLKVFRHFFHRTAKAASVLRAVCTKMACASPSLMLLVTLSSCYCRCRCSALLLYDVGMNQDVHRGVDRHQLQQPLRDRPLLLRLHVHGGEDRAANRLRLNSRGGKAKRKLYQPAQTTRACVCMYTRAKHTCASRSRSPHTFKSPARQPCSLNWLQLKIEPLARSLAHTDMCRVGGRAGGQTLREKMRKCAFFTPIVLRRFPKCELYACLTRQSCDANAGQHSSPRSSELFVLYHAILVLNHPRVCPCRTVGS